MRALVVIAIVVLALALAAQRSAPSPAPLDAAPGGGSPAAPATRPATRPPPADVLRDAPEPGVVDASRGGGSVAAATTAPPAAAPQRAAPRSAAGPEAPVASPAAFVKRFVPGSRAHAAAITEKLASTDATDNAAPVARLYRAFFGRIPDFEGLDHYSGERRHGTDLAQIAGEFAGSPEMRLRHGELDDAAFLALIERNAGQAIDPALRAFWLAELAAGRITRGEVVLAITESPRYRAATDAETFVILAYAEVLQRAPAPAELRRWVMFLAAGNPRSEVVAGLLGGRR